MLFIRETLIFNIANNNNMFYLNSVFQGPKDILQNIYIIKLYVLIVTLIYFSCVIFFCNDKQIQILKYLHVYMHMIFEREFI